MAGLLVGLLVSCEDKALAAKSREQKALIAELEAEVNMLQVSMGDERREDPASGLEAVGKELEDARSNEEELRSEIERLKAERAQVEKDFERYQRKYQITE
jgi:chromosome segregation ATPase